MMSVFYNYIYYIQPKNSSYLKAAPERSEVLIRDSGAELNHARSARILIHRIQISINIHPYLLAAMTDYWGIPEKEYELSLLQFAGKELSEMGYSVLGEKVEVCSGAGALTLTAIIKTKDSKFGLYLHDGPKHRKTRGLPVIRALRLLPGMKTTEDLRSFVLSNQNEFQTILAPEDASLKERAEADIRKVYTLVYNSKIKDLYDTDLSSAADVLRIRLRKSNTLKIFGQDFK